jgi:hypothetical protein
MSLRTPDSKKLFLKLDLDDVPGFSRDGIDGRNESGAELKGNVTGIDDTKVVSPINLKAGIDDTTEFLGGKRSRSNWMEHGREVSVHPTAMRMCMSARESRL